jgi:NADH-quinone oxidoreductase subunit H
MSAPYSGFDLLVDVLMGIVVLVGLLGGVAYTTFFERRFAGFMQGRPGPNRAGPWGVLQPLADGLKFLFKEDFVPRFTDRFLYRLAPWASFVPALVLIGVIPLGPDLPLAGRIVPLQVADPDFGLLYFLAVASFGVYGVIIAGWGSNNKYSLFGGMRASAMMISYEVAMGLAVVALLLVTGTVHMSTIVAGQDTLGKWNVWRQPFGFFLFLVAAFAESHRIPFDLPEAEQELVGGYQTEYGSMQLGLFQMAEYAHMIAASALMAALYFGGWHFPGLELLAGHPRLHALAGLGVMGVKTAVFLFFYIWVRWTIPRFRFDQLMRLGWKVLLPLGLANLLGSALGLLLGGA